MKMKRILVIVMIMKIKVMYIDILMIIMRVMKLIMVKIMYINVLMRLVSRRGGSSDWTWTPPSSSRRK